MISGISLGIVVIEAGLKSGTMHTVKFAKEQNKIIMVADVRKEGNNKLIQDGFPCFKFEK
ncbi:DNA-processing protein DprA [Methanothermobacter sp.]|uniref:DNA-processing protein DprA n=1 Tax=Methanothermobacter sp. TaxID=1884223 RepID=UPI00345C2498